MVGVSVPTVREQPFLFLTALGGASSVRSDVGEPRLNLTSLH